MPPVPEKDDVGSLERARAALYNQAVPARARTPLSTQNERSVPHEWEEKPLPKLSYRGVPHIRLASIFLGGAVLFFLLSLGIAGYFLYSGGNSVSIDKVTIDIQGPTTIAGGDTVPLSLTITNKNPVALENATIEIDFPEGTRSATNVLSSYPRYVETIGNLASGETITRSVKAVLFGGAGQTLTLPVSFSYGTGGSNAVFEKKTSFALAVSSTPISISVDALTETVSGQPLTFTLTVRSNAIVPLSNVVLTPVLPFGFSVTSSSIPLTNSSFLIGTLAPGASKHVTLTGTLSGQDGEQRVFHFTIGTAKSAQDQSPVVAYMTQDAAVSITAPFITTTLDLHGDASASAALTPGSLQNATLSYLNTLSTVVTNATITVAISGSAIDYDSIKTTSGFYDSSTHSIVFNQDTDPTLSNLAPGASGIDTFTFSTLPVGVPSPTVNFTISVSGTRVGQSNVPEQARAGMTKVVKVATSVLLSAFSSHTQGFSSSGPVPPRANQATTYSIVWNIQNTGSAIAGGTVTATLPSYVLYTGKTSGMGTFSYDDASRSLTWNVGDLPQGGNAQGIFQISFTPSVSQKGGTPALTSVASFSGYDRFAGVQISSSAGPATTEARGDVSAAGIVQ